MSKSFRFRIQISRPCIPAQLDYNTRLTDKQAIALGMRRDTLRSNRFAWVAVEAAGSIVRIIESRPRA
jgi:hypothetical protein